MCNTTHGLSTPWDRIQYNERKAIRCVFCFEWVIDAFRCCHAGSSQISLKGHVAEQENWDTFYHISASKASSTSSRSPSCRFAFEIKKIKFSLLIVFKHYQIPLYILSGRQHSGSFKLKLFVNASRIVNYLTVEINNRFSHQLDLSSAQNERRGYRQRNFSFKV